MRHYQAMVAAAEKLGFPVRFKNDLYRHDKAACERMDPAKCFLWSIGPDGTWIVPEGTDQGRRHIPGIVQAMKEAAGEGMRFFFWDGSELKEVAEEEAMDRGMTLPNTHWLRADLAR